MAQKLTYPLSAFNYVFSDLREASHLRISVPDDTIEWLSTFAGDVHTHAYDGFSPQEKLVDGQEHRRLFYMLLRILLPADASTAVDDIEKYEQSKNDCVDAQQFEDAARWLRKKDVALEQLADWVEGDTLVTPTEIQLLFDMLERDGPGT